MKLQVKVTAKKFGGGSGGGGTTTQVVESIPAWARPYMEKVGQTAEAKYAEGALGRVADVSDIQRSAFDQASAITGTTQGGISALEAQQGRLQDLAATGGRDALMESAAYNAAKQRAGMDREAGAAGTLGSARTGLAQAAMEAELADKATQQAIANRMTAEQGIGSSIQAAQGLATGGASSLANLGDIQRGISQQQLDTDWQALERYASTIFGNPARQSATQQSSGGGGK
jgi:hypothetical protein